MNVDIEQLVAARLDMEYIAGVAADVASTLADGDPIQVAYQPGDGTFYGLVFVPLDRITSARPRIGQDGNEWERHACRGIRYTAGATLVAWVDHMAYPLQLGPARPYLHWSYVAEHWQTTAASAEALAILFRAVADRSR